MLKKDIKEFVTNYQYMILAEMQSNATKRGIELVLQERETRADTKRRD